MLRRACNILNIECTISHGYLIYDKKSNTFIALSYILELSNGVCPFLEKNRCLLHNYYKPLVCRAFPYVPKVVRYLYDSSTRTMTSIVEYGVSRNCPAIEAYIKHFGDTKLNPLHLYMFMPSEVAAAAEMERKRSIILSLLSTLWRKGILELEPGRKPSQNTYIVNVYDVLRRYYPSLPYILDVYTDICRINRLAR